MFFSTPGAPLLTAPTKVKVLAEYEKRKGGKLTDDALDRFLNKAAGQRFHNHSPLDFQKLKGDPDNIEKHLVSYIKGFSANVRTIFNNKRAFATAASDMLMKEVAHNGGGDNVRYGDIFTDDQFPNEKFDYLIANPPFGVDWKKQAREIENEHKKHGHAGRFGAGLPRVNDGSLLFLQHMISK